VNESIANITPPIGVLKWGCSACTCDRGDASCDYENRASKRCWKNSEGARTVLTEPAQLFEIDDLCGRGVAGAS